MNIKSIMPPKKIKTIGEEPSCSICCNTYNKSTRKEVSCNYCVDKACLECIKRFLLDTTTDYHCMFCRNKWSKDVLVEKLPQKFINEDLRTSLENRIVDIEKARLPLAQEIAEIQIHNNNIRIFSEAVNTIKNEYSNSDSQKELIELFAKNYGIKDIDNIQLLDEDTVNQKGKKTNYIRACPNSECRGFINSEWNCGLCNTNMCKTCYEIIDNTKHTCNPDIIKSNQLIKKDSRPCPKCSAIIFRISGCAQMFCVVCHTAFNWNTGTMCTGPIHNPHYFQWLQKQDKPVDTTNTANTCNFPAFDKLLVTKSIRKDKYCEVWTSKFYQYFVHIYNVNRPYHIRTLNDDSKMKVNVSYLLGKIGKTEWKKQLFQIDKNEQISRDVLELIDMAYGIAGERFRAFITDDNPQHIHDLEKLIKYVIEQTELIRKRHCIKNVLIGLPEWYTV
jgi:hypothetical protein